MPGYFSSIDSQEIYHRDATKSIRPQGGMGYTESIYQVLTLDISKPVNWLGNEKILLSCMPKWSSTKTELLLQMFFKGTLTDFA